MNVKSTKTLRRSVQGLCLLLFCLLLGAAERGGMFGLPADLFLRLDPLMGVAIPVASRAVIETLLPALGMIVAATLAGRLFCGWVCPMGTTLDAGGSVIRFGLRRAAAFAKRSGRSVSSSDPMPRSTKYLVLGVVLTAAVLGVNMAFWASPIPLVTRLYALVLHPLALLGVDGALATAEPILDQVGISGVQYWYPSLRSYATAGFVAVFWLVLLVLEALRPRFWCRYLCPAGALLGIASRCAFWKRRTNACNRCGRCAAACPAGILHAGGSVTNTTECLTCRACESACSKGAVRFGWKNQSHPTTPLSPLSSQFIPSRRALLGSVAVGTVLVGATGLEVSGAKGVDAGIVGANLVRPPGSVPESDFLARCVRCGECMKACPTGGLQPAWLQAGFSSLFSPFLDPRSGPCAPECAACGNVCPSRAIQALPLQEKRWAKIGTAVVDQHRCLAWAEDRRCMVCQETCPYGAVSVMPQEGHVAPVPVVRADWCYGCGYCERHCPTATASIRVEATGALRQQSSGFESAAKAAGLELDPAQRLPAVQEFTPENDGAPPGFLD